MPTSRVRLFSLSLYPLVAILFASCAATPEPPADAPVHADAESPEDVVARGRHLVATGLCHDCHTPKKMGPNGLEPDMDRMLMGHPEDETIPAPFQPTEGAPWIAGANGNFTAWSGPWGVSFAANLTPDPLTGLRSGVWTKALFMQALRTGRHFGTARSILPPMPWNFIGQLSDSDLDAIWAFLATIPPIENHVPVPLAPTGEPIE
jgi:hypothetical protein